MSAQGAASSGDLPAESVLAVAAPSQPTWPQDQPAPLPAPPAAKPMRYLSRPKPGDLPEIVAAVNNPDLAMVFEGVCALGKVLSVERDPPIDDVIVSGVVPRLVQLLADRGNGRFNKRIAFEAAWALTNIAAGTGEHAQVVIDAGGVDAAMDALQPPATRLDKEGADMIEQCTWLVGNIIGEGPAQRDLLINRGIVAKILPILDAVSTKHAGVTRSLQRNVVWAVANIMRGQPEPDWTRVTPLLPACVRLAQCPDRQTRIDALWALTYCTKPTENEISELVVSVGGAEFCRFLAKQILDPYQAFATPALHVTGNMLSSTEAVTQALLDAGVLPGLFQIARTGVNEHRRKVAFRAISNITAGTEPQALAALHAGLVPLCCEGFRMERDTAREALWAISNAASRIAPRMIPEIKQHVAAIGAFIKQIWKGGSARLSMLAFEFVAYLLQADRRNEHAADSLAALLEGIPDFGEAYAEQLEAHEGASDGSVTDDDADSEPDDAGDVDHPALQVDGAEGAAADAGQRAAVDFWPARLLPDHIAGGAVPLPIAHNPAAPSAAVELVAQKLGSIAIDGREDDGEAGAR